MAPCVKMSNTKERQGVGKLKLEQQINVSPDRKLSPKSGLE